MKKGVIVDVDAGSDDAVAILLLLTSESERDFRVLGVTCTHGNTTVDNVCRNVLVILESINRLDVPVFRGAEGPLISPDDCQEPANFFHGKDGLGDIGLPPPKGKVQPENAVAALNRLSTENEGISLICLGPLTNIALAIRTYSSFTTHLREVFIMGGNTQAVGNASKTAEFNFYKDPEAAHIVVSSLSCPVTILPWEPCINPNFPLEERFAHTYSGRHIKLMDRVDAKIFAGMSIWNPCDAFLAAMFLEKKMIEDYRDLHLSVELRGMYTKGQGVVDHTRKMKSNVRVVDKFSVEIFKKLFIKMASFNPN